MDPKTAQQITETPKARTSDVHEWVDLSEARLDPTTKAAEVTLLRAGWSKNNRHYSKQVVKESAPLFEGVKAYANHPKKSEIKDRPERSVLDAVGVYENVHFDEDSGALRATYRAVGKLGDDLWPWVIESAEGRGKPMGLSIHALGRARKGEADGKAGLIIEAITYAESVDFVTAPAAGGGFDRLLASDDGWTSAVIETLTLDELREARPDFIADLKREWKTTRDSEAIQEARATVDDKSAQLAALTEENRTTKDALAEALDTIVELRKERAVDRLLEDAKLPKDVSKELREKLMAADGPAAMQAVIETAIATLAAVRLPVHVHGAGRAASPTQVVSTRRQVNPIAEAMGVDPRLAGAETFDEFLAIQKQLNEE